MVNLVAREEYHSYANTWTLVTVPIFQHIPLRSIYYCGGLVMAFRGGVWLPTLRVKDPFVDFERTLYNTI